MSQDAWDETTRSIALALEALCALPVMWWLTWGGGARRFAVPAWVRRVAWVYTAVLTVRGLVAIVLWAIP